MRVVRRAWLFMPGSRMKFIKKAAGLDVDVVCMDLEDGVSPDSRAEAHDNIRAALETLDFGQSDVAVRITSPSLSMEDAKTDMETLFKSRVLPKTLCVPKIDTLEHLQWIYDTAGPHLQKLDSKLALVTMCESPTGLLNLSEILRAASSTDSKLDLQAVIFGGDDYAATSEATRTSSCGELMYARQHVVACCRAYGVDPLDIVHITLKDPEGLRREAEEGALWGFAGKQVIHPSQVEIVQQAFTPTKEAIEEATELLAAYQEHYHGNLSSSESGAFLHQGKMIDLPTVRAAEHVLARAAKT
ncbi:hypothetical protein AAMO2058_001742700 [Amorphochlora amoebiformis]